MYLPQLPVIGTIAATTLYMRRPLLFWTIVTIVFSRHRAMVSDSLYHQLAEVFVTRLKSEVTEAPLPLSKIHVLMLLIIWPLPVSHQARDPGLLYSGLAIQACRYMGVDREQNVPSLCSIGVSAGHVDTRIKTWIGCFYATTS